MGKKKGSGSSKSTNNNNDANNHNNNNNNNHTSKSSTSNSGANQHRSSSKKKNHYYSHALDTKIVEFILSKIRTKAPGSSQFSIKPVSFSFVMSCLSDLKKDPIIANAVLSKKIDTKLNGMYEFVKFYEEKIFTVTKPAKDAPRSNEMIGVIKSVRQRPLAQIFKESIKPPSDADDDDDVVDVLDDDEDEDEDHEVDEDTDVNGIDEEDEDEDNKSDNDFEDDAEVDLDLNLYETKILSSSKHQSRISNESSAAGQQGGWERRGRRNSASSSTSFGRPNEQGAENQGTIIVVNDSLGQRANCGKLPEVINEGVGVIGRIFKADSTGKQFDFGFVKITKPPVASKYCAYFKLPNGEKLEDYGLNKLNVEVNIKATLAQYPVNNAANRYRASFVQRRDKKFKPLTYNSNLNVSPDRTTDRSLIRPQAATVAVSGVVPAPRPPGPIGSAGSFANVVGKSVAQTSAVAATSLSQAQTQAAVNTGFIGSKPSAFGAIGTSFAGVGRSTLDDFGDDTNFDPWNTDDTHSLSSLDPSRKVPLAPIAPPKKSIDLASGLPHRGSNASQHALSFMSNTGMGDNLPSDNDQDEYYESSDSDNENQANNLVRQLTKSSSTSTSNSTSLSRGLMASASEIPLLDSEPSIKKVNIPPGFSSLASTPPIVPSPSLGSFSASLVPPGFHTSMTGKTLNGQPSSDFLDRNTKPYIMLENQQGEIALIFSRYFVVTASLEGQPQDLQVKDSNFYYRDGLTGLHRKLEMGLVLGQRVRFNCAKFTKPIFIERLQVNIKYYVTNAWEEGGRAMEDDEDKVEELIRESKKAQASARMSSATPPSYVRNVASQSPLLRKISSPSLSTSPQLSIFGQHIGDVSSASPAPGFGVGVGRDTATPLLNSRRLEEMKRRFKERLAHKLPNHSMDNELMIATDLVIEELYREHAFTF